MTAGSQNPDLDPVASRVPDATGPKVSVIVGSIGYRRLLTTLIRAALPTARIEEIDPFSQTMRGSGVEFGTGSNVMVLGGIGTESEALSALERLRARDDCPPIIVLVSHDLAAQSGLLRAAGAAAIFLKDALSQNTLAAAISDLSRGQPAAIAPRRYGQFMLDVDGERVALAIDGYQPLVTMAANAMSHVFLAETLDGSRRVVIKLPLSTPHHDVNIVRKFCERYACLCKLNGRSVVRYLDAGIAGSWPYVVLEHLSAGDLRRRMAAGLTTVRALDILHQLAVVLADVHAAGFVHMDVKPENIFFRDDRTLVLIDFNISTPFGGVARSARGDVLGSPFYMSPEQGRGLPVDGRSDLYSAGVILFEMLTGERPFSGENSTQVIFQHLHAEIPLLPKRIRHLQPLIDSLLAKNPDERFADTSALIDALRPHLADVAGSLPTNE